MKHHFHAPDMRPPDELIAASGGARVMRDLTGKLEIVGGTEQERTQAHDWMKRFMSNALLTVQRQRVV